MGAVFSRRHAAVYFDGTLPRASPLRRRIFYAPKSNM
jgi:hypothetical protein